MIYLTHQADFPNETGGGRSSWRVKTLVMPSFGLIASMLRNTPKTVNRLAGLSGIVGIVAAVLQHLVLGGAIIFSTLLVYVVIELYNTQNRQEEREQQWNRTHRKPKTFQPPLLSRKQIVTQCLVFICLVGGCGWGAVKAYALVFPPPFVMTALATIWSKTNASMPAAFVAFIPVRKTMTLVNAAVYLRLIGGTQRQTISKYDGYALVGTEWEPLISMPEANETFEYYYTGPANKPGAGWKLPVAYDLISATDKPLEPGDTAEGWLFFAYSDNLSLLATKLRVVITTTSGQSVSRDFEVNDFKQLDLLHLPQLPDTSGPPITLGPNQTIWYAKMVGQ